MKIITGAVSLLLIAATAGAQPACPKDPIDAATREFPSAGVVECNGTRVDGHDVYDVQIAERTRPRRDVIVSLDGRVLEIDEQVDPERLPAAVKKAFGATYPGVEMQQAQQRLTNANVTYRIIFRSGSQTRSATFTARGELLPER